MSSISTHSKEEDITILYYPAKRIPRGHPNEGSQGYNHQVNTHFDQKPSHNGTATCMLPLVSNFTTG